MLVSSCFVSLLRYLTLRWRFISNVDHLLTFILALVAFCNLGASRALLFLVLRRREVLPQMYKFPVLASLGLYRIAVGGVDVGS